MKPNTVTIISMSLAAAWTPPAGGQGANFAVRTQMIGGDTEGDPGFAISQMGAVPLIHPHAGAASRPDTVQINRDECGSLQRFDDGRSLFDKSAFDDDNFVPDDEDPALDVEQMFSQWLAAQVGIAAMNGAIDHWCDTGDDEDLGETNTSSIV